MLRKPTKPPAGAKLKETADMVAWRKEFEKMKTEDHLSKLKELGLDDEDLDDFKELKKGKKQLDENLILEEKERTKKTPLKKLKMKLKKK